MNPAAGGCAQPPPPPAKGTSGRFTIPTNHYMTKSMMNLENSEPDKDAISFKPQEPQEELVKVKACFGEHQFTALVDSGSQRS